MELKINIDDDEAYFLYHCLNAFGADFHLILNGEMTFEDLQKSYDKDINHIRDDMEIFNKFAFNVKKELEYHFRK